MGRIWRGARGRGRLRGGSQLLDFLPRTSAVPLYPSPPVSTLIELHKMVNTYGVYSPTLFLLREGFNVDGGHRDHSRYLDAETLKPKFFAQHRRSCLEAALFAGRDKVSNPTRLLRAFVWGEGGKQADSPSLYPSRLDKLQRMTWNSGKYASPVTSCTPLPSSRGEPASPPASPDDPLPARPLTPPLDTFLHRNQSPSLQRT